MSVRRSLRNRVAVTLAVFAGVVSLILAVVIYLASHDLEERLIDETLTAELDDYVARRERNPQSLPERTATIRAFVVASDGNAAVPAMVASLVPGQHRLVLEGIPYRAAARDVAGLRYVVLYDISALKRREQGFLLLLAVSVGLITLISALAGRWLAGRVIAPVNELARRVAVLRPEDGPAPLAGLFPWNEVQRLAADFDAYLLRLHDFIERERLFTGDVSHELRTPMAVINGATELLLNDPGIDGKNQERIARIGRAVAEMGEISGALLALAREQQPSLLQPESCDAGAVASELVERYRNLRHGKPVELTLIVHSLPVVRADRTVLAMVLGNLLRNALGFTENGEVRVTLNAGSIVVEDTGQGLVSDDSSRLFQAYVRGDNSSGAGLGLSLVKRLCDRQGWRISLSNRPAGGACACLTFSDSSDSSAVTALPPNPDLTLP
jgi:signal transduction histidine kinase